ncbi:protein kinase [Exilibacterium tricleocarpae]|uniref:Protein kinase n=1 Tax=Exilibacterium tricleocarpae TaxID=2591008 RepID=A0A545TVC6_9GAMM|nr:serine/threonine-protein kinase [Exilibacterium tricleocarpae]TQV81164.1 protein kinase [Exilibacterium tricleocarpae]
MSCVASCAQLNEYEILKPLGQGGMGIVYLARDIRLQRHVAIKFVRHAALAQAQRKRLLREGRLLARLSHPNIVQLYSLIDCGDQFALVMEYIAGADLRIHLKEQNPPLSQRLGWVADMARGLDAVHRAGIIHRDLKVENILVARDGTAKLTDFGIAKLSGPSETQHSQAGVICGSYSAMSPEQIRGDSLDKRSDLFALGTVAYSVLCGVHPFAQSSNHLLTAQRILHDKPLAPVQVNPQLSERLSDLIASLLEKEPGHRPASAAVVARQITTELQAESCDTRSTHRLLPADIEVSKKTCLDFAKQHSSLSRVAVAFFALAALLVVLNGFLPTPSVSTYVAVLPPGLNDDREPSSGQLKLIQGVVYDSLEQEAIRIQGLELISREKIRAGSDTPAKLAQALGADVVVTSHVDCAERKCVLTVSRLQGERWSVFDQKRVPVLTDSYLEIANTAQRQLRGLFADKPRAAPVAEYIEEADYLHYLSLYQAFEIDGGDKLKIFEELQALLVRAPRFPPLYRLYSLLALDLYEDSYNSAYLEKLRKVLLTQQALLPESVGVYRQWFALNLAQGRYDQALASIDKMRELEADDGVLFGLTAYLYYHRGQYEEAIPFYQKALAIRQTRSLYYNLALNYWSMGHVADAKNSLDKLFVLSPDDYHGRQLRATLALSSGDLQAAVSAYSQLAETNPSSINLNNLGLAYLLQKQYGAAREAFLKAVALSPNHSNWLLNLADTEKLLANYESANAYYSQVIALSADDSQWAQVRNRALSYAQMGDFVRAIKAVELSQRLAPDNAEVAYNAALVYTLAGELSSALVQVENAVGRGVGPVWFSFSWFDSLCLLPAYGDIFLRLGYRDHCPRKP